MLVIEPQSHPFDIGTMKHDQITKDCVASTLSASNNFVRLLDRTGKSTQIAFFSDLAVSVREALRAVNARAGKVCIVTGCSSAQKFGYAETVRAAAAGFDVNVFAGIPQDPPIEKVKELAKLLASEPYAAVIAIGGGSVIDFAKVATCFSGAGCSIEEAMREGEESVPKRRVPLIALPTTAGTGSEATPYAVLCDKNGHKVFSRSDSYLPDFGAICTDVLETLSPNVIQEVGFDAFAHALEALWSKQANDRSDAFAVRALRLFGESMVPFRNTPKDQALAAKMAVASSFAGLAFAEAYTSICHALSFPISDHTGLSHGHACALTIEQVAEFYSAHNSGAIETVTHAWGLQSTREIPMFINTLKQGMDMNSRLRDFGVTESDLEQIACQSDRSMTSNSALPISRTQLIEILRDAV